MPAEMPRLQRARPYDATHPPGCVTHARAHLSSPLLPMLILLQHFCKQPRFSSRRKNKASNNVTATSQSAIATAITTVMATAIARSIGVRGVGRGYTERVVDARGGGAVCLLLVRAGAGSPTRCCCCCCCCCSLAIQCCYRWWRAARVGMSICR